MRNSLKLTLPVVVALLCTGCYSLTSFQSTEVLPPRQASVGAGLAYVATYEGDLMQRYGLLTGVDVGYKIALPFGSLSGDVKCQVWRSPMLVAADIGGSYGWFPDDVGPGIMHFWSVYPELIVGYRRFYVAARMSAWLQNNDRGADWIPQVFVGASFGDQIRVQPELLVNLARASQWEGRYGNVGIGLAFEYRP